MDYFGGVTDFSAWGPTDIGMDIFSTPYQMSDIPYGPYNYFGPAGTVNLPLADGMYGPAGTTYTPEGGLDRSTLGDDSSWLQKALRAISATGKAVGGGGAAKGAERGTNPFLGQAGSPTISNPNLQPSSARFLAPAEYGAEGAKAMAQFIAYLNRLAPMLYGNQRSM